MIILERRASAILYNILRARGDRRPFLLPANVCPIVPATFMAAMQPFELVDIAEPWLEIDPDLTLQRLRDRPGAYAGLLFVRPYGSERSPAPLFARARAAQPDLLIIDDKALCRPDCSGESSSALADVTLFSTGHAKHTDLDGGGFAHLSDRVVYRRAKSAAAEEGWLDLRAPEISWEDYERRVIEEMRAADEQKAALNAIYRAALPPDIQCPSELQRWRFNIRVPKPDELIASIFAAGLLFASRHYPPAAGGDFPIAARVHSEIVNLFNDRHFDVDRAERVAALVVRHVELTRR